MKRTFILLFLAFLGVMTYGKTPIKVFIIAGQSNAVGNGDNNTLPNYLKLPQEDIRIKVTGTTQFDWGFLRPGLGSIPNTIYGLELSFGHNLALAAKDNKLAIIKVAFSGTNLDVQWRSPSAGGTKGPSYNTLVSFVNKALAELSVDFDTEVAGFIWMQGESDAMEKYKSSVYESNLKFFIKDVRTIFNTPSMPFIIAMIPKQISSMSYYAAVRDAQLNVFNTVDNVYLFDANTIQIGPDNLHFTSAGYLQLGADFALATQQVFNTLPTTIEAENYDKGGEGVGFHDTDIANTGGQYRSFDAVDIEACSEGSYDIAWTSPGEWLQYTVNIPSAGDYKFSFRMARALSTNGAFHLEVDGVDKTGPIAVPTTGGWQTWINIDKKVSLKEGKHSLKVVFETGDINFDKVNITIDPVAAGISELKYNPSIYPNPANDKVTISGSNTGIQGTMYNVYDLLDKMILSEKSYENNHILNISSFKEGIYFIRVTGENKTFTKKLIILR